MKSRGMLVYLGALAAVMAMGLSARAESVTVSADFTIGNYYRNVTVDSNLDYGTTSAGIYNFTNVSVGTSSTLGAPESPLTKLQVDDGLGTSFRGVCIDFTHSIANSDPNPPANYTWYVVDLSQVGVLGGTSGSGNGVGISEDQKLALNYLNNVYFNAAENNADLAATYQMAVWDVLYNGGGTSMAPVGTRLDFTGQDTLEYNAGVLARAARDAAISHDERAESSNLFALVSTNGYQDFSIAIGSFDNTVPTPLPAAAWVGFSMLAGFGGVFGVRKQAKRKARIA